MLEQKLQYHYLKNKIMKKLYLIFIALITSINHANAAEKRYPNITGTLLTEIRMDNLSQHNNQARSVSSNAGYINAEFQSSINFNKNWSVKNSINFLPTRQRQYQYPERSRFILGQEQGIDRGINIDDSSLIVEEIKVAYENEDMKFAIGKLNPKFATLYRRNKRIGFFITDFTEDYEIREQIGYSLSALLEDSELTFSNFFADTTGLSDSGLNDRGKRGRNDNTAGNTGTLSSYTVNLEGRDFFGVDNLFYNIGYRNLGVEKGVTELAREVGYTVNLEYLYQLGRSTFLIPIIEAVKIENFTGRLGRDAEYITAALIMKYSGWNVSISHISRDTDNNYPTAPIVKNNDSITQFNIGYKFENNIALDISRAEIEEDNIDGTAIGVILSYFYEF